MWRDGEDMARGVASRHSRSGFLSRVAAPIIAWVAGPLAGSSSLGPESTRYYGFCGHTFTTKPCPHPFPKLPRIDRHGYPLRPSDGHAVDDASARPRREASRRRVSARTAVAAEDVINARSTGSTSAADAAAAAPRTVVRRLPPPARSRASHPVLRQRPGLVGADRRRLPDRLDRRGVRTIARRRAIERDPIASAIVRIAARPSGTAATATDTPTRNASRSGSPRATIARGEHNVTPIPTTASAVRAGPASPATASAAAAPRARARRSAPARCPHPLRRRRLALSARHAGACIEHRAALCQRLPSATASAPFPTGGTRRSAATRRPRGPWVWTTRASAPMRSPSRTRRTSPETSPAAQGS